MHGEAEAAFSWIGERRRVGCGVWMDSMSVGTLLGARDAPSGWSGWVVRSGVQREGPPSTLSPFDQAIALPSCQPSSPSPSPPPPHIAPPLVPAFVPLPSSPPHMVSTTRVMMMGLPTRLQAWIRVFCTRAIFSGSTSRPRLPRLRMMPSASLRMPCGGQGAGRHKVVGGDAPTQRTEEG